MQMLAYDRTILDSVEAMEKFAAVVKAEHVCDEPLKVYAIGRSVARRLWDQDLARRCRDLAKALKSQVPPDQSALFYAATVNGDASDLLGLMDEHTPMGFFAACQAWEYCYLANDIHGLQLAVEAMHDNDVEFGDHDTAWERALAESCLVFMRTQQWPDYALQKGYSNLPYRLRGRAQIDLLLFRVGIHS